jgi:hypothetical protein
VLLDSGAVSRQSMVYTDYFAAGTEPTSVCVLHPTRGIMGALASWFTFEDRPAPPKLNDVMPAPSPAAVAPDTPQPAVVEAPPPPEPERRRGFWSRLFGRGRDRDRSEGR